MTDIERIVDIVSSTNISSVLSNPLNERVFEDDNCIYYISESDMGITLVEEDIVLDYIYLAMMKFNINKQLVTLFCIPDLDVSYYESENIKIISYDGIKYVSEVYNNTMRIEDNLIKSCIMQPDLSDTIYRYIDASIDEFKDIELFIKILKLYKLYIDFESLLSNEDNDLIDIEGEYRIALIRFIKDNNILDMKEKVEL